MNKWQELEQQLTGNVYDNEETLKYFSTDGSIFTIKPAAVVYPKDTQDVVATVKYAASQGTSVVARGKGTDQGGGAIGQGIMLAFPAHMNTLVAIGKDYVTVQPGMIFGELQKILHSHGRFLPPYPASMDFSSIGGAVANNAAGEKTLKYGSTRDYITSLQVVLDNGDIINTKRLSAHELSRKKGQMTREGEIYRQLDAVIEDNKAIIDKARPGVSKNSSGYNLWDVKRSDGSFDLGQLIVGSQGTLGVVTQATVKTMPFNPHTSLIVGFFDDIDKAGQAVVKLEKLKPSAMEVVDYYLLDFVKKNHPGQLEGLVPDPLPKIALLVEFDDASQLSQTIKTRRAIGVLAKLASSSQVSKDPQQQAKLWQIRRAAAASISQTPGAKKALPIIEDGVVPIEKLPEFLDKAYKLLKKHKLQIAVWGHAGNANFHLQPYLDLSKSADHKKVFELMDEFYDMVIKMGGSTCGEHNDGLLRAPYLPKLYGKEIYGLFRQVKNIFDPGQVLNPGKKVDVNREATKKLVRKEYSMPHLYDHLPHN